MLTNALGAALSTAARDGSHRCSLAMRDERGVVSPHNGTPLSLTKGPVLTRTTARMNLEDTRRSEINESPKRGNPRDDSVGGTQGRHDPRENAQRWAGERDKVPGLQDDKVLRSVSQQRERI